MTVRDLKLSRGLTLPDRDGKHVVYRYWRETDDVDALTALLHEVYAPLAAAGMRFVASHQDSSVTLERITRGETVVAVEGSTTLGTITLKAPPVLEGAPFYGRDDVAAFGQFAVRPREQKRGIGGTLMSLVERRAMAVGAAFLALDTSEHAHDLIKFYEARGFRFIEYHRWDSVNYRSVLLAKPLGGSTG